MLKLKTCKMILLRVNRQQAIIFIPTAPISSKQFKTKSSPAFLGTADSTALGNIKNVLFLRYMLIDQKKNR